MAVITLHPDVDVDRIGPGLAGGATAQECLLTSGDGKAITFSPFDDPRAFVTVGFEDVPAGATVTALRVLLSAEMDNTDGGDVGFLLDLTDGNSGEVYSGQIWSGSGGENTTVNVDVTVNGTWSDTQINGLTARVSYNESIDGVIGNAALFDLLQVIATYTIAAVAPSSQRLSIGIGIGL
jgi:hypothetical protein